MNFSSNKLNLTYFLLMGNDDGDDKRYIKFEELKRW